MQEASDRYRQQNLLPETTIVPTIIVGSPEEHYRLQLKELEQAIVEEKSAAGLIQIKRRATALEEIIIKLRQDYGLSVETLLYAVEVRINVQRKLGRALAKLKKGNSSRRNQKKHEAQKVFNQTLTQLGITKSDLALFQRLASPSNKVFESILEKVKNNVLNGKYKSISTTRILTEIKACSNGKDSSQQYSSIIKPSDNWNFSSIRYPRLEPNNEDWGYIPGDLYANCLWYYAKPRDIVVVPMAGTGQIQRVYDTRQEWMNQDSFEFTLKLFDLNPRGPYKDKIKANDLTQKLPVKRADYIIMDIPYFGMARQQYSNHPRDIANLTSYEYWLEAIQTIAKNCAVVQFSEGRCTVITPNYRNVVRQEILTVTDDIRSIWTSAGYKLFDKAYASRRIQKQQSLKMARMNKLAKSKRIMLTDISEILTFAKI